VSAGRFWTFFLVVYVASLFLLVYDLFFVHDFKLPSLALYMDYLRLKSTHLPVCNLIALSYTYMIPPPLFDVQEIIFLFNENRQPPEESSTRKSNGVIKVSFNTRNQMRACLLERKAACAVDTFA